MKQQSLVFITSNMHKVKQVQKYLDYPVEHINLDLTEIQSLDPMIIVEHKAKEAYQHVKKPVLVEDTSLIFNSLGKLPGPFIKWFLQEIGNEGMCKMLDDYKDRSAIAWILFAYYDGTSMHIFDIKQNGTIADHPREGGNAIGWNRIFIPDGETKTLAEMNEDDKDRTSLRKRALIKLKKFLIENEE
jgi:non-canonical purine NTP pyrophosphatase (RdgB/HAM1 family)